MNSTKQCDRCENGQADTTLTTDHFGTLCPKCHAVHVMYKASGDHLVETVEPVLRAWAHHWVGAGLSQEEVFSQFDSWPREITMGELFSAQE